VVYYLDTSKPSKYITGAVRFGLKASSIILPSYGYVATAHGGCAEAVMDDVLGTVVRHCQSVWMATSDFSAKVSQPLPASAPPNLFHFTSLRSPFPSLSSELTPLFHFGLLCPRSMGHFDSLESFGSQFP